MKLEGEEIEEVAGLAFDDERGTHDHKCTKSDFLKREWK